MKKVFTLILVCLLFVSFSSCGDDSYRAIESNQFYPTDRSENLQEFFLSLEGYVKDFDDGLSLGFVQVLYDNCFEESIMRLFYSKAISKSDVSNLVLEYDAQKGGIVYAKHVIGSNQVIGVYNELNTSEWQITLEQGKDIAVKWLQGHGVDEYVRINCFCAQDHWKYVVFDNDDLVKTTVSIDSSSLEIIS